MRKCLKYLVCSVFVSVLVMTGSYASMTTCEEATDMLTQCTIGNKFDCMDCCTNFGYFDDTDHDQYTVCYNNICMNSDRQTWVTDYCNSSGGDSGGGSGSGGASCTTNEDCWGLHPICDATTHTCREAYDDNNIVNAQNFDCYDGKCVCHFIVEQTDMNSAESFFTAQQHCGQIQNYEKSLGFPQSDCQTLTSGRGWYVVQYTENTSYPICQGYIAQSSERSRSCDTCNDGFTRLPFSSVMQMTYRDDYVSQDFLNWPCSGGYSIDQEIYVCVQCVPKYGSWVGYGTGYQRRLVSYNPDCDTSTDYQYQCAAGYYGSSTNGTSGCTRCPLICNSTDLRGTSPAGATSVSDCCAAAGSTGNDGFGSFSLRSKYCGA